MKFGEYLRELRKAKGLTLTELGEMVGLSKGYLSHIENGSRETPSADMIRQLSQALDCTHIGMMIRAGYVTQEEVLTYRKEHGIKDFPEVPRFNDKVMSLLFKKGYLEG